MATATYYAKAKVRIGKLAPTVSHNDIYIGVDYGAGDPTKQTIHRTLLWFDLASPADQGELVAGAVIASAVIKGSVTNTNGTPITCRAERLTRDYYGYDHTTWNNYDTALAWTTPGGDKDSTGSATFPMPTLGDDKTIADITALAIDAVDNRAGDLRVVLRADDESLYTTETHWTNLAYDDNPPHVGPYLVLTLDRSAPATPHRRDPAKLPGDAPAAARRPPGAARPARPARPAKS